MVLSFLVLDNTSRLHIVIYVNVSPTVVNSLEYALLHTSCHALVSDEGGACLSSLVLSELYLSW